MLAVVPLGLVLDVAQRAGYVNVISSYLWAPELTTEDLKQILGFVHLKSAERLQAHAQSQDAKGSPLRFRVPSGNLDLHLNASIEFCLQRFIPVRLWSASAHSFKDVLWCACVLACMSVISEQMASSDFEDCGPQAHAVLRAVQVMGYVKYRV